MKEEIIGWEAFEKLLEAKPYSALTMEEKRLADQFVQSEGEYTDLRDTLVNIKDTFKEDLALIMPSPKMKANLMEKFESIHGNQESPVVPNTVSMKPVYRMGWFKVTAVAAVFLFSFVFLMRYMVDQKTGTVAMTEEKEHNLPEANHTEPAPSAAATDRNSVLSPREVESIKQEQTAAGSRGYAFTEDIAEPEDQMRYRSGEVLSEAWDEKKTSLKEKENMAAPTVADIGFYENAKETSVLESQSIATVESEERKADSDKGLGTNLSIAIADIQTKKPGTGPVKKEKKTGVFKTENDKKNVPSLGNVTIDSQDNFQNNSRQATIPKSPRKEEIRKNFLYSDI